MPTGDELNKRQLAAAAQMKRAFNKYIDNVSKHVNNPKLKFAASFQFRKNDLLREIVGGKDYTVFKANLLKINRDAVTGAWNLANEQTGEAFKGYAKLIKKYTGQAAGVLDLNQKALTAFISGRGTKPLSTKVWKAAGQFKDEMAVHLGMGIANGDSAATLSRRTRQYLNNPDALFRRIKTTDKFGKDKWKWSKRAQNYKPGRGRYRSAFKNARRVAVTETNKAYVLADQERFRKQKFVTGYRVVLSANHPKLDICDDLKGKYPKDFVFSTWHPHCRCGVLPILMPEDQFVKYLKGNKVKVPKYDLPMGFKSFMARNKNKIASGKFNAHWLADNIVIKGKQFLFNGKQIKLPKNPVPNIAPESKFIPPAEPVINPVKFQTAKTLEEVEN